MKVKYEYNGEIKVKNNKYKIKRVHVKRVKESAP